MTTGEVNQYQFSSDWFSRHTGIWSELLLPRRRQILKVLEIGSYEGRSTVWIIANILSESGDQIFCIDVWQNQTIESRFDHNISIALSRSLGVHVEKLKGRSTEATNQLASSGHRSSFDLIYIDGSHEAPDVLIDLCYSFQLCKVGGLMICDDYLGGNWDIHRDPITLPKIAIDAFTNIFTRKLSVLEAPLYQIYLRKCAE